MSQLARDCGTFAASPMRLVTLGLLLSLLFTRAALAAPDGGFSEVAPGVEVAAFKLPAPTIAADGMLHVVRVDPAKADLGIFASDGKHGRNPTALEWVRDRKLVAVVNAGMFEQDHKSTTGYGRIGEKHLNPRWKKIYRAAFVSGPRKKGLPPARLLDGACDDVESISRDYENVVQSLRMVDCEGKNTWGKDSKKWSAATIAVDGKGRVLFLHSRSPYTMHGFVEQVRMLPLDVKRMMYLEGGPEASLVVSAKGASVERTGSFETGFMESDDNVAFWPLPNVIGVRAR